MFQVEHKVTGQIYAMKELKKRMIIESEKAEHTMSERSVLAKVRRHICSNLGQPCCSSILYDMLLPVCESV